MEQQKFINAVKDGAIEAYRKYNIFASLTIAQAILESGWGKYAPGNNLFGIKWSEGCGYDKQLLDTQEWEGGKYVTIKACFRAYNSMADSVYDHAQLLLATRYEPVRASKTYIEACQQIKVCGYATSPTYTENLIKLIEQYELYKYDVKEEKKVENLVVYGNVWYKDLAEGLAEKLKCPVLNGDIPYDYSVVKNVYCVGIPGKMAFTSYAKQVIYGGDWTETKKLIDGFTV